MSEVNNIIMPAITQRSQVAGNDELAWKRALEAELENESSHSGKPVADQVAIGGEQTNSDFDPAQSFVSEKASTSRQELKPGFASFHLAQAGDANKAVIATSAQQAPELLSTSAWISSTRAKINTNSPVADIKYTQKMPSALLLSEKVTLIEGQSGKLLLVRDYFRSTDEIVRQLESESLDELSGMNIDMVIVNGKKFRLDKHQLLKEV